MEGIIRELAGFANTKDADALAEEISMIMEGAYVTRQVTGNPRTAEIASRLIRGAVDRRISGP